MVGALGAIKSELEKLARLDPQLSPILERIAESAYVLEDVGRELMSYADRVVFDQRRQDEVEERLGLISRLVKKHAPGGNTEDVLARSGEMALELERLKRMESELGSLRQKKAQVEKDLAGRSDRLHAGRERAAQKPGPSRGTGAEGPESGRSEFRGLHYGQAPGAGRKGQDHLPAFGQPGRGTPSPGQGGPPGASSAASPWPSSPSWPGRTRWRR